MNERPFRRTGIEVLGELPWGAHICMFYETPQDLIEAHAEYFGAGLEDGEFCFWVLTERISHDEAVGGLRDNIPGFDGYLARGQIELFPGYEWYLRGDEFDPLRITRAWHAKLDEVLARGFAGMQCSGNAFWFETNQWGTFRAYEDALNGSLAGRRMIGLCSYALSAARGADVLDVARTHNFSIARRRGRWEFLKSPELAEARAEISRLNDAIGILSNPFPGHDQLTPRERVTLAQIVRGASNKQAARALEISPRTVEFHRANIMRKLGTRNVVELVGKVLGNTDTVTAADANSR